MNILLSGHTGFLGRNILSELSESHEITTLGRANADIHFDFASTETPINQEFDLVIHAAGKAHVIPKNVEEAKEFQNINFGGTIRLTNALKIPPKYFVFISSVSVYGLDFGEEITEDYPLEGTSPYALSKINAEEHLTNWFNGSNTTLTILRLPLIVGKNPPGNLGSLYTAIKRGRYLRIKNNKAKKSMVLATDVASFIPVICHNGGTFNLTDGIHPYFCDVEDKIANRHNVKFPTLPFWIIKFISRFGDVLHFLPINSIKFLKITSSLTFSDEKAQRCGWKPNSSINYLTNI